MSSKTTVVLSAVSLALLLVGFVYYVACRNGAIEGIPVGLVLLRGVDGPDLPLSGQMPSFLHSTSFCIAVSLVWRARGRRIVYCCSAWLAVELVWEVLQHGSVAARIVESFEADALGDVGLALVVRYAVYGTFDPFDLVAVSIGALTAAGVLQSARTVGSLRNGIVDSP